MAIPERRTVTFNDEAAWTPQEKRANLWLCTLILCVVGLPSILVASVSTIFNFMYASGLGTSYEEKAAWGVASLGFSLFVIGIPIARPIIRPRNPSLDRTALWLWIACVGFSITSALGFAFSSRDETAANKGAAIETRSGIKSEIKRLEGELDRAGAYRPREAVKAEIASRIAKSAYVQYQTGNCTRIETTRARKECVTILELRQELAAAEGAADLQEQLFAARRKLATIPVTGTVQDPQADALDAITGRRFGETAMRRGLSLFIALLIEAGAALGLNIAAEAFVTVLRDPGSRVTPTALEPASAPPRGLTIDIQPDDPFAALLAPDASFNLWTTRCVSILRGNRIQAKQAYEAYSQWCMHNALDPLLYNTFTSKLGDFVVSNGGRAFKSNTTHYEGIKIAETPSIPLLTVEREGA